MTNRFIFFQAAHVGVGISGEEGLQAVNSSDYAIAQVYLSQSCLSFVLLMSLLIAVPVPKKVTISTWSLVICSQRHYVNISLSSDCLALLNGVSRILNFFYKNIVPTGILWWYQIYSAWSGYLWVYLLPHQHQKADHNHSVFDYTYILFWNSLWTILPVIGIGLFDRIMGTDLSPYLLSSS